MREREILQDKIAECMAAINEVEHDVASASFKSARKLSFPLPYLKGQLARLEVELRGRIT